MKIKSESDGKFTAISCRLKSDKHRRRVWQGLVIWFNSTSSLSPFCPSIDNCLRFFSSLIDFSLFSLFFRFMKRKRFLVASSVDSWRQLVFCYLWCRMSLKRRRPKCRVHYCSLFGELHRLRYMCESAQNFSFTILRHIQLSLFSRTFVWTATAKLSYVGVVEQTLNSSGWKLFVIIEPPCYSHTHCWDFIVQATIYCHEKLSWHCSRSTPPRDGSV